MNRPVFDSAVEAIRTATHLTMACHVSPDGDALGSMLALARAALDHGIPVAPTFGGAFEVPETLRFLPLDLLVRPAEVPDDPSTMVCFDTGSADRLGEMAEVAARAQTVVVIDHHVTNEGFGDVALIEPDVSSTAELTLAVIRALGWSVTPAIAECLLVGIVTDTGRFQYSNTGPRTLEAAAQLVAAGAHPERIGQHVYEEVPFGYLAVAGGVAGRAVLEPELKFVWSSLLLADLIDTDLARSDVEGLIDLIRLPRESDVALLVKEVDGTTVKGSLRSRGRVDVGSIAADLGGGGHHNAAGFTFSGDIEAAVAAVRERLTGA